MAVNDNGVLAIAKSGPVALVTLNRPEVLNALNFELRQKLREAVTSINADAAIRVAIIKGAGSGFCSGADLSQGVGQSVCDELETQYKPLLMDIALSDKLWMASMHGTAAGIGGSLAMACDLAVMAENANIYLAFAAIGLIPDGGATWHLLKAMGHKRALQTIIEGRKIPASQCLEFGLVNRLASPSSVHEAALRWAHELARGAPLAQAAAKRALRHIGRMRLQDAITLEAKLQQKLVETEDHSNGVEAFLAKRKPEFKGR